MTTFSEPSSTAGLHTIGAVCERLRDEFPDISISKIRYLEDQGLLQPSRTRGGYRLFRKVLQTLQWLSGRTSGPMRCASSGASMVRSC